MYRYLNAFVQISLVVAVALSLNSTVSAQTKEISDCQKWANAEKDGTGKALDDGAKARRANLCAKTASVAKVAFPDSDSIGFSTLGITPQNVVQPRNPEDLTVALLNGVDPEGKFQSGVAIEIAPFMLVSGKDFTLQRYHSSFFQRLKANTKITLATARAVEDNKEAQQIGLAFQFTPWIENDPLRNKEHLNCLEPGLTQSASMMNALPRPNLFDTKAQEERANERKKIRENVVGALADKCAARFSKTKWNTSGWTFGVTPAWTSTKGDLDSLEWSGAAVWSSLSINPQDFNDNFDIDGTLNFQVRYRTDEKVVTDSNTGAHFDRDTLIGTLGYTFGADHLNLSLEASFLSTKNEGRDNEDFYQFSANLKYGIPNTNLWLSGAIGGTSSRDSGNDSFVRTSLNWAFNEKAK